MTAVPDVKGAPEFGISGQLLEWQTQNIRLCTRRFGIEWEHFVEALGRGPRFRCGLNSRCRGRWSIRAHVPAIDRLGCGLRGGLVVLDRGDEERFSHDPLDVKR